MIRGQAGQTVGAQMLSALDGSAFAGVVTVYITGDGGTQTLGSIGGGLCTNEGNGYFSYTPSATETDFAFVAFTFVGSGAINQTVQGPTTTDTPTGALPASALSTHTGQDLLNCMEVLARELQLQPGESDVRLGLTALNMAQDYLESVLAAYPGVLGGVTGTMTTAANTETTAFPVGVLRVDLLQLLDSDGRVSRDLDPIYVAGGHAGASDWLSAASSSVTGAVRGYWTNGRAVYWAPRPDDVYTIRWNGFQAVNDLTAVGTFGYPDVCMTPLATLAVRFIRTGLDDPIQQYQQLADELFTPVVEALSRFQRERAPSLEYRYAHDT